MSAGKKSVKILIAVFLPLVLFGETVFLNDTFNDGDRSNQNLPDSAAWYQQHTSESYYLGVIEKDPGNYVYAFRSNSTTTRGAHAYFAPADAPAALTLENNILRFSFDTTVASEKVLNSSIGFRFALINSGANRSLEDTTFSIAADGGYLMYVNPSTGELRFARRNEGTGGLANSTGPWDNMDTEQTLEMTLVQGTTYTWTMELELLPTGDVKITVSVFDGTDTKSAGYVDTEGRFTEFDTVAFVQRNPVADDDELILEYDNMRVVSTSTPAEPPPVFAEILLNDRFNDGDRTVQALPDSAAWFATHTTAGTAEILHKGGGEYLLAIGDYTTDIPRGAVAYFTAEDSPAVLTEENNILRYSFDFTPTAGTITSQASALRFVILESQSGRISTDTLGNITASGYGVNIDPETGELRFRIREGKTGNYLSTIGNYGAMAGPFGMMALEGGTTYRFELEIERLPDGDIKLTASIFDGAAAASASYTDDTYQYTRFDTIGIATRPLYTGMVEIDNVRVSFGKEEPWQFFILK